MDKGSGNLNTKTGVLKSEILDSTVLSYIPQYHAPTDVITTFTDNNDVIFDRSVMTCQDSAAAVSLPSY